MAKKPANGKELRIRFSKSEIEAIAKLGVNVKQWAKEMLVRAAKEGTPWKTRKAKVLSRRRRKEDYPDEDAVHPFDAILQETDRGCVLIISQAIDDGLRRLIREHLIHASGIHRDDLDRLTEGPIAPLGTFSARADLAFALGLINDNH